MKGSGKSGLMPLLWLHVSPRCSAGHQPVPLHGSGTLLSSQELVPGLETLHLCWAGFASLQLTAVGSCSAFSMLLGSYW